ncbi:MAG TPA: hypothetical protein VGI98_04550 [Candidatus Limnocylindrales bacterium]|jgi:hypothetical protein
MNLTLLWLFLHITLLFAAVAVAFGGGFLMRVAFMTGQVGPIRGVGMVVGRVGPLIPILFLSGGLFGLITAISFGTNLLSPWLVIAYVLFAIAMYIGVVNNRAFGEHLGQIVRTAPDGPVTPEIVELFNNRREVAVSIIDYVILAALIFDMVVKPFS